MPRDADDRAVEQRVREEADRFVRSDEARALPAAAAAHARGVASAFLRAVYRDLGQQPRDLGLEELGPLLLETLPAALAGEARAIPHVPAIVRALYAFLASEGGVVTLFEVATALDAIEPGFAGRAAARPAAPAGPSVEPLRRGEPKIGRNERCPCGSGRKHKACCGR